MDKARIYYNYLEDIYPDFKKSKKIENEIDQKSEKLNRALYELFFSDVERNQHYNIRNITLKKQNFKDGPIFSFFIDKPDCILSTDYIGPSVWWCSKIAGYTQSEINGILKKSRTLGGHLAWARGQGRVPTVNQVKGGELRNNCGYGFYDRIDWTLFLLKTFYSVMTEDIFSEEQYIRKIACYFSDNIEISDNDKECFIEIYRAFNRSKDWFAVFCSFNNFCEYFKLKGSFVDDDCNVIALTNFFPIKPTKETYREYTENNLRAILQRNRILENC